MHKWLAVQTISRLKLTEGCVALDVGAGTALAAREIAARVQGNCTLVALDLSAEMLRAGVRSSASAKLLPVVADGSALPFRDAVFDIVVCVSALSYFRDPDGAIREWKRVLRQGGQLAFQVFESGSFSMPRMLRAAANANGLALSDPNAQMGSRERCADALRSAGFREIEVHSETWSQQLTDPEGFLKSAKATWLRYVFETLSPSLSAAIQADFLNVYAREVGGERSETCGVLIAVAR